MVALAVTVVVRRSPPSREQAIAAARAHARHGSVSAVVLGSAAALWAGTARLDAGLLAGGTRLPTMRALAADLGVATGTVARAYAEPEPRGW